MAPVSPWELVLEAELQRDTARRRRGFASASETITELAARASVSMAVFNRQRACVRVLLEIGDGRALSPEALSRRIRSLGYTHPKRLITQLPHARPEIVAAFRNNTDLQLKYRSRWPSSPLWSLLHPPGKPASLSSIAEVLARETFSVWISQRRIVDGLVYFDDDCIEHIQERLSLSRRVLISGLSGSGKTSLAIAAAVKAAEQRRIGDATWYIDIRDDFDRRLADELANYLARESAGGATLILDNAHIAPDMAAALIQSVVKGPGCRIIVTTRSLSRDYESELDFLDHFQNDDRVRTDPGRIGPRVIRTHFGYFLRNPGDRAVPILDLATDKLLEEWMDKHTGYDLATLEPILSRWGQVGGRLSDIDTDSALSAHAARYLRPDTREVVVPLAILRDYELIATASLMERYPASQLRQAIRAGLVEPVSRRAGSRGYRLACHQSTARLIVRSRARELGGRTGEGEWLEALSRRVLAEYLTAGSPTSPLSALSRRIWSNSKVVLKVMEDAYKPEVLARMLEDSTGLRGVEGWSAAYIQVFLLQRGGAYAADVLAALGPEAMARLMTSRGIHFFVRSLARLATRHWSSDFQRTVLEWVDRASLKEFVRGASLKRIYWFFWSLRDPKEKKKELARLISPAEFAERVEEGPLALTYLINLPGAMSYAFAREVFDRLGLDFLVERLAAATLPQIGAALQYQFFLFIDAYERLWATEWPGTLLKSDPRQLEVFVHRLARSKEGPALVAQVGEFLRAADAIALLKATANPARAIFEEHGSNLGLDLLSTDYQRIWGKDETPARAN